MGRLTSKTLWSAWFCGVLNTVGAPPAPQSASWWQNLVGPGGAKDLFGSQGIIPGLTALGTAGTSIYKMSQDAAYQRALQDYRNKQLQYRQG